MPPMQLTNPEINMLNSYCGAGDLRNANILFFFNEEGLGGQTIQQAIAGKKSNFPKNQAIDLKNKFNGHYHLIPNNITFPNRGALLEYTSRLMKYKSNPSGNWFDRKHVYQNSFTAIKQYQKNNLFREKVGFKSAHFELRPLPRKNESSWPYLPNNNILQKDYNEAFKFYQGGRFNKYHDILRKDRVKILQNLFNNSSAEIFIGVGAVPFKKNVIKRIYPHLTFKPIPIGNVFCDFASLNIGSRPVRIFLCPFFAYRGKGIVNLSELSALARLILYS